MEIHRQSYIYIYIVRVLRLRIDHDCLNSCDEIAWSIIQGICTEWNHLLAICCLRSAHLHSPCHKSLQHGFTLGIQRETGICNSGHKNTCLTWSLSITSLMFKVIKLMTYLFCLCWNSCYGNLWELDSTVRALRWHAVVKLRFWLLEFHSEACYLDVHT